MVSNSSTAVIIKILYRAAVSRDAMMKRPVKHQESLCKERHQILDYKPSKHIKDGQNHQNQHI